MNLDGETNLKMKKALKETWDIKDEVRFCQLDFATLTFILETQYYAFYQKGCFFVHYMNFYTGIEKAWLC